MHLSSDHRVNWMIRSEFHSIHLRSKFMECNTTLVLELRTWRFCSDRVVKSTGKILKVLHIYPWTPSLTTPGKYCPRPALEGTTSQRPRRHVFQDRLARNEQKEANSVILVLTRCILRHCVDKRNRATIGSEMEEPKEFAYYIGPWTSLCQWAVLGYLWIGRVGKGHRVVSRWRRIECSDYVAYCVAEERRTRCRGSPVG